MCGNSIEVGSRLRSHQVTCPNLIFSPSGEHSGWTRTLCVKPVLFYGMASHLIILFIFLAKDPRHLTPDSTLYAWARHHSPLLLSRLLHQALYIL